MDTGRPTPDPAEIKERQRLAWASGDYAAFGAQFSIMSELLCEAVNLQPARKVLDVATGSGNTALAAARRSAEVTGLDYAPSLLQRGRERAAAERLAVDFREGDAERLPFADASFDFVLSTVGVMFAPNQRKAACELLRVCRSGGKIGLANWTPEGFSGRQSALFGRYLPPPEGLQSPMLWGTEERLRELLGGVESLEITRRSFVFRYRSVDEYLETLKTTLGPTRSAFETLAEEDGGNLTADIKELVQSFNVSGDETMVVPADYLEVVATRR